MRRTTRRQSGRWRLSKIWRLSKVWMRALEQRSWQRVHTWRMPGETVAEINVVIFGYVVLRDVRFSFEIEIEQKYRHVGN